LEGFCRKFKVIPLHWKMIPNFIDRIAYLDIETTGLSPRYSYITTIAVYDRIKVRRVFVFFMY